MGQSKYSNALKSYVIEFGYTKNANFLKKVAYERYCDGGLENSAMLLQYLRNDKVLDCAFRLNESEYKRYIRLNNKINKLVSAGGAIFITLTFTDDVLSKTSALTRRRYVSRYLKDNCDFYVANVDFSPEKDREHYHAVVGGRCDFAKWTYGFVFAEQVRTHDGNSNRVARYVAKLSNHALKVKSHSSRLIYSRNVI